MRGHSGTAEPTTCIHWPWFARFITRGSVQSVRAFLVEKGEMRMFILSTFTRRVLFGAICAGALIVATTTGALASGPAAPSVASAAAPAVSNCTAATCSFPLAVNPGLAAGKPFACPAMAQATATISVTNRFKTGALNDTLTLTGHKLPPKTGFDLFLVQHSAFDTGFSTFGFGWYQSDVESDASGNVSVSVRGVFDHETFVLQPPSTAVHTFNVGFWFDSPTAEATVCHSAKPAATPFNGEQNAGLLAMITKAAPLGLIH
jgi:hypothetical protein